MENNTNLLDSDIIDQEIQRAFRRSHGLTMLDFRTGSGKSFDLEKNIARFIHGWCNGHPLTVGDSETAREIKQIVVLIPNKNNFLSYDSLAKRLIEIAPGSYTSETAKQVIHKSVYTMQNNLDCMITGLSKNNYMDDAKVDQICNNIENLWESSVAKELVQDFHCIRDFAKCRNNINLKDYAKSLEQAAVDAAVDICGKMRSFINKCKKVEKDEDATPKLKEMATKDKEKCIDLVTSFYETARYDNYKVIITTVDKFMYSVDPIISSRFCFYDRKFTKNRIFILDESDSAYMRMRDVIVDKINKGTFPYKEYLKNLICNCLLSAEPSQVVANAIKLAFDGKTSKYSWEALKCDGKEFFEKFYLRYPYKTDKESEKNGKMPALLNDGVLYTLSEKKGYIHAVKSKTKKQVLLRVGNGPEDTLHLAEGDEVIDIAKFFSEGNALLFHFCCFLNEVTHAYAEIMIKNEKDRIKKAKENKEDVPDYKGRDITFLDDLATILNQFGIIEKDQLFYKDLCINLNNRPRRPNLLDVDNSFYIKGYDFKIITDNAVSQAENSIIYSHLANITPESILLSMAQRTHVICLSATALNRSVNENFDISYLSSKLPDFYTVSEENQGKLRAFYAHKEEPYADGRCRVDIIALPENSATVSGDELDDRFITEETLPNFQHPEILKNLLEQVRNTILQLRMVTGNSSKCNYCYGRYLNLIRVFYDFIHQPLLKSMVGLEKAALKKNNLEFDLGLTEKMINAICLDLGIATVPLITATADDFNTKKNEVITLWEKGEKAIFFSTYQTTSKGSNLQYKIPTAWDIRKNLVSLLPELCSDERFYDKYNFKDVDCLYLGYYSYLVQKIEGENLRDKTECFHKVFFELQKLAYAGQIGFWQKQAIVRNRYRMIIGNAIDSYLSQLIQTEGIRNAVNKIIKQSVGRIDRVNQKNSLTKIFIASENLKLIDLNELAETESNLTPAMKKIFEAAKSIQGARNVKYAKPGHESTALHMAERKHIDSVAYFDRVLSLINQSSNLRAQNLAIQEYNRIRNLVLCYPVISQEIFNSLPSESQKIVKRYYFDSQRDDVSSYVFTINPKEEGWDLDRCHIQMEGFNSATRGHRMAEENTVLNAAVKVNGVYDIFEQKGFCTKWETGRYILSPKAVYIYNGILGEEVERIILAKIIKDVEEMSGKLYLTTIEDLESEVFERFDFRYGNIYIDAKNWRFGVQNSDAQTFRRKVLNKKAECDAFYHQNGTAVVLNLLPLDGIQHPIYQEPGYCEIPALIDANGHINEQARNILFRYFAEANRDAGKNK